MKRLHRILTVFLAFAMLVMSFPVGLGEETIEATPEIVATPVPTQAPTAKPTEAPTAVPTEAPTEVPTEAPTAVPTEAPTEAPTAVPTDEPTAEPTQAPTEEPTDAPTDTPTPTDEPSPTGEPLPTEDGADASEAPDAAPANTPEPTAEIPAAEPAPAATRFQSGYVFADAASTAYKEEALETALGVFDEKTVVYALARTEEADETNDVFEIRFAFNDEIRSAYISVECAEPLDDEQCAEYAASAVDAIQISNLDISLLNCAFTAADDTSDKKPTEVENTPTPVPSEEPVREPAQAPEPANSPVPSEEPDPSVSPEVEPGATPDPENGDMPNLLGLDPDDPMYDTGEGDLQLVESIELMSDEGYTAAESIEAPLLIVGGAKLQLVADVSPDDALNRQLRWSIVEGANAASVNSSGLVTTKAVSVGVDVIVEVSAIDNDDDSACAYFCLRVCPKSTTLRVYDAGGKTFNGKVSRIIPRGENVTFYVEIAPEDAISDFTVVSSNTGVAGIELDLDNSSFDIVGISDGTAVITVQTADGAKKFAFNVTVRKSIEDIQILYNGEPVDGEITVARGVNINLDPSITPADATNHSESAVTWKLLSYSSSLRGKLTYKNTTGVFRATRNGDATVVAVAKENNQIVSEPCVIHFVDPVSAISLEAVGGTGVHFPAENAVDLISTVRPAGANQALTYYTKSEIVTLEPTDEGVRVLFTQAGEAVIYAKACDGSNRTGSITLRAVENPVTEITVTHPQSGRILAGSGSDGKPLEIAYGKTISLATSVNADADYPNVGFRIREGAATNVLTLYSNGRIKPKRSSGTTIVEVYPLDSINDDAIAAFEVVVKPKQVSKITLSASVKVIDFNETTSISLKSSVQPSNASKLLRFVSSDESIASVEQNEDGVWVVNFKKVGIVNITAYSCDGANRRSNILTLKAVDAIDSLEILNPITAINVGGSHQLEVVAKNSRGEVIENPALRYTTTSSNRYVRAYSSGKITGVRLRNGVKVTVRANDGISSAYDQFTLNVTNKSTPVSVDTTALEFDFNVENPETTAVVTATLPDGVSAACFTSSNTKVAAIENVTTATDEAGVRTTTATVHALGAGTAQISVLPAGAAARYAVKLPVTVRQDSQSFAIDVAEPENEGGASFDVAYSAASSRRKYCKSVTLPILRTPAMVSNASVAIQIGEGSDGYAQIKQSGESIVINPSVKNAKPGMVYVSVTPKDSEGNLMEALRYDFAFNVTPMTTKLSVSAPAGSNGIIDLNDSENLTLQLTATPSNAACSRNFLWKTSNAKVATVDSKTGLVTAVSSGKATIYAYAQDSKATVRGAYTVTVQHNVTNVAINPLKNESGEYYFDSEEHIAQQDSVSMIVGQKLRLTPLLLSLDQNVTASTRYSFALNAKTKAVTVTSSGTITAKAVGKAEIVLKANDGSGKSATILVEVYNRATSVSISKVVKDTLENVSRKTLPLYENDPVQTITLQAKAVGSRNSAARQEFVWTTSNPAALRFKDGVNTGAQVTLERVGNGYCVITARATDGSNKSCTVAVNCGAPAERVIITGASTLTEGKSVQLRANIFPKNALSPVVEWSVAEGSEDMISVKDGLVKSIGGAGQAKVKVKVTTGGTVCEDSFILNIVGLPSELNIMIGDYGFGNLGLLMMSTAWTDRSLQLHADVLTEYAPYRNCNQAVTWSSSNSKIVKVDASGKVTAVAASNSPVTITAKSVENPKVFSQIRIKVINKKPSFSIVSDLNENYYEYTVTNVDGVPTCQFPIGDSCILIDVANATAHMPLSLSVDSNDADKLYDIFVDYSEDQYAVHVSPKKAGLVHLTLTPDVMPDAAFSFNIEIVEHLTDLRFAKENITLNINNPALNSAVLEPVFTPASPRTLFYEIPPEEPNRNVASVDQSGRVTALRPGTVRITATEIGGHSASCLVTVISGPSSVTITPEIQLDYLYPGESLNLRAAVDLRKASSAYNGSVTWTLEGISDASSYLQTTDTGVRFTAPSDLGDAGSQTYTLVATASDGMTSASYEIKLITPSAAGFEYRIDDDGVTITKYNIKPGVTSLRVPNIIDGKKVTCIAADAFVGCEALTEVVWPEGIDFEEGVWDDLVNVKTQSTYGEFQIVDNVLYRYLGTGKKSVTIPAYVTKIGDGAFQNNSTIESVSMPNQVTEIGMRAFANCSSLKNITCYN